MQNIYKHSRVACAYLVITVLCTIRKMKKTQQLNSSFGESVCEMCWCPPPLKFTSAEINLACENCPRSSPLGTFLGCEEGRLFSQAKINSPY